MRSMCNDGIKKPPYHVDSHFVLEETACVLVSAHWKLKTRTFLVHLF